MNAYSTALKHFLDQPGVKQQDVATRISRSQAALNRYAHGRRFPDADTAKLIDTATKGVVGFKLWQSVAMERLGIGHEPAGEAAAASATKIPENVCGDGEGAQRPFSPTSSATSGPEEDMSSPHRSSTG